MYSIYHFYKDLVEKKEYFNTIQKLEDFPYDLSMIACKNNGVFPDIALKLNNGNKDITGGEFIELKDSASYTVSSFNSTIPTGRKEISKIILSENSQIKKQMEEAGNHIYSVPIRDVFYLIRGKKNNNIKICLVHGSFFETISIEDLIKESFGLVLEERLSQIGKELPDEWKYKFLSIFSEQKNFSKVRDVNKSSVKLRFRIMTEVKAEGNLLNSIRYPEIIDNSMNFLLPLHNQNDEENFKEKIESVFGKKELKKFNIFKIKHLLNGYFLNYQTSI